MYLKYYILQQTFEEYDSYNSLVLDGDRFCFQILIKRLLTQILSESRHLEAAEGNRYVRLVVRVDEHSASVDLLRESKCPADILGEDTRGQTELGVVRPRDHLVDVLRAEFGDHHDGSERLFLGYVHIILDVCKHGRLEVPAGTIQSLATVNQRGTFLDPDLHKLQEFTQMGLVILRSMSCAPVQWVADGNLLHLFDHASHELVVDGLLDEKSSCTSK